MADGQGAEAMFVNEVDKRRTIDHERNVVLEKSSGIGLPGRREPQRDDPIKDSFLLRGDDFQIRFEAHLEGADASNGKRDITWLVYRAWDAKGIEGREEEIINLLVEAINSYGVYFGKSNVNSVTVEFGDKYAKALTKNRAMEPIITLENN